MGKRYLLNLSDEAAARLDAATFDDNCPPDAIVDHLIMGRMVVEGDHLTVPELSSKELITWSALASLIERAAKARTMHKTQRWCFDQAARQLREDPLHGRKCNGCGGPIMQKPISDHAVTYKYSCTCPNGDGLLNPDDGWVDVPPAPEDLSGGITLIEDES